MATTTQDQRETVAFGLEQRASLLAVGAEVLAAWEAEVARTNVDSIPSFIPRFHVEAHGIVLQHMATATIRTAEHVRVLLQDDSLPVPEAEANDAADASSGMLRLLAARYEGALVVDATRAGLLGQSDDAFAERLLADLNGELPEGSPRFWPSVRNAYVTEAQRAVNVQISIVKYSMLAAAPEAPDA